MTKDYEVDRIEQESAAEERAACAELVRATGCLCWPLERAGVFEGVLAGSMIRTQPGGTLEDLRFVEAHDSRCPIAIAAEIEARGKP